MKQIVIQQTYIKNEVLGRLYNFDRTHISARKHLIIKQFFPHFQKDLCELKGVPGRNETKVQAINNKYTNIFYNKLDIAETH